MAEEELLSIDEIYTDGTKIEASANKYTFVWKKSILTNKEKEKKQLTEIWQCAQQIAADEDKMSEPPDFKDLIQTSYLKGKLCYQCQSVVVDTSLLKEEDVQQLVLSDPHTCLKVNLNQNNITITYHEQPK